MSTAARDYLAKRDLIGAYFLYDLADRSLFDHEEFAIASLVAKLVRVGFLTEAQIDFCRKALAEIFERRGGVLKVEAKAQSDASAPGLGVIPKGPAPVVPPRDAIDAYARQLEAV